MNVSTAQPEFQEAMASCVTALRRVATYQLDPSLANRMDSLGERKEFLDPALHEELLALVAFAQQRTVEKLQAQVALDRLRALFPSLVTKSLPGTEFD
jgi:hypothetical protein